MPQDQVLPALVGVLVGANVLLLSWIALRGRGWRRSGHQEPIRAGRPGRAETIADARAAAAIEAFVTDAEADATGRRRPPSPWELIPPIREVIDAPAPTTVDLRDRNPAGLADPATWDRAIRDESARAARFGRPVTVVVAELHNLDDVADRLGRGVAERVVAETARVLVADGRALDRIASLGGGRFGVLLLETEESAARGYVDRVRAAADGWLESAGLSIRLSLGWASPTERGDIVAAAAIAEQRMYETVRRTSTGAARVVRADAGDGGSHREGQPVMITSARSRVSATSAEFNSSLRDTQARASSSDLP